MRHTNILAVATALFIIVTTPAFAGGIYIGGGVGSATIEDSASNPAGTAFNESDSAFKIFGGYRFDWLPIVSLSGEVGFRDLGKPSTSAAEYKVDGFDYGALAGLGLGPVELFARVGGMQYDLDKTIGGTKTSFDGSAPVYGVGARFSLFGIGVRAEYEKIDIDELDNVEMISVSAFYEF
ncbi:MAG: outer membrane beta-barrel protein [Methylocella sp.]